MYNRIEHGILDAEKNDAGGYGKTEWRQKADFPLGPLFDGGIHSIAELTQLFGVPQRVLASGRKWRADFGEYDEILMQFTYASGLRGVFSHAAALPWVHCGFTLFGSKGVMHPAGNMIQVTDLSSKDQEVSVEQAIPGMWEQILDAYQKGSAPPYSSAQAAQDVAILESVAKAIHSGNQEPIAIIGDH
jgi:predicted dehydrogenase